MPRSHVNHVVATVYLSVHLLSLFQSRKVNMLQQSHTFGNMEWYKDYNNTGSIMQSSSSQVSFSEQ